MPWATGIATYIVMWWIVLFAVLPLGVEPDAEASEEAGGWRGTPRKPQLLRKAVITTVVTAVLWLALDWVIESDWLNFRTGWLALPEN